MALTKAQVREILSSAGVDSEHMKEAVDKIIDGHVATVDALKEDIGKYKPDAEKLEAVQKELDELKKTTADAAEWQKKAEDLEKKYNDLVSANTEKEAKAAKESAARAYYESKGITGKALDIAIRGSGAEIAALEIGKDGKIKDSAALEALVKGDFSGLVGQTHTEGAPTATPPANVGGKHTMTKEEIMNIKDIDARHKAIAENGELFGIT